MKYKIIYTFLLILFSFGLHACDSTTAPEDPVTDQPYIADLSVSPQMVEFTFEDDGYRDTTLTININVRAENISSSTPPVYSITKENEVILEGEFNESIASLYNYSTNFELITTTTSFENYLINATVSDENGNLNYAQSTLRISGFSNNKPEILQTNGPEEITRPSSGEIPATFTAKVTDRDGQETIEFVYIRVVNMESGEVEGSPFEMFDDGSTFNDTTANDSTYTWSLPVTPTDNNPNRDFDIEFFAIDLGGSTSDTVRTTFKIRE